MRSPSQFATATAGERSGGISRRRIGTSIWSAYALKRLFKNDRLRKVARERLTEPLHLNMAALFVALFGSFRAKVEFDLVIRPQFAFPMLYAADRARRLGIEEITAIEFGVANGAGLLNMCRIAQSVTKATGVRFRIYGFDTATGMPPAIDYRDRPEGFQHGDFPMSDRRALLEALPPFAELVIGDIKDTVPPFLERLSPDAPLAFVSLDVDYYSSSVLALPIFSGEPEKYLPMPLLYLDDIVIETANPWCGELLAVAEFNQHQAMRKIAPLAMLRARRVFKNALWIDQIYGVHIFDHSARSPATTRPPVVIPNEYL
jgi:hypothetical protein